MKRILVLCTGNSCRSQIAEAYMREFAQGRAEVYSAGIETHGLNPRAVKTMAEDRVDISKQTSTNVNAYDGESFDFIITVCDHANENCPYFPGKSFRVHHNFPDPAKAIGTEEDIRLQFNAVRDEIKVFCKAFVDQY